MKPPDSSEGPRLPIPSCEVPHYHFITQIGRFDVWFSERDPQYNEPVFYLNETKRLDRPIVEGHSIIRHYILASSVVEGDFSQIDLCYNGKNTKLKSFLQSYALLLQ